MGPLTAWFRSADSTSDDNRATGDEITVARERQKLEDALMWTSLIMNDDIDAAWQGLQKGDSSFHSLGLAVAFFIRSVLGFEQQFMAEASAKLADCETRALSDRKRAQRRGLGSRLYPAGTEYELVRAETQLMAAVVGVLQESLVEAMRSFYKLRKAFVILDAIITAESKVTTAGANPELVPSPKDDFDSSDSDDFVDARDKLSGPETPVDDTDPSTSATTPEPSAAGDSSGAAGDSSQSTSPLKLRSTDLDDPIDVFIHSGANMCFGIMLLILSLIPPAFSRVLSVVGFRGDRTRGVRMLWRSAAHRNINGAVAGMVLLTYYNSILAAVDIVPDGENYDDDAESMGTPWGKCDRLLADLRTRYPDSQLWRVEEARLLANQKKLSEAIELLRTSKRSQMKQVVALNDFELAVDAMMVQDWTLMRDTFLRCLEVSDWSPAMYYYMAGCAALELYRDAFHSGAIDEARRQKSKAEEYLRKAPQVAGKKRLMARQLPIETFIQRKAQKWETRATALGADLADVVGPSPALQMCYIWSGQKRMDVRELDRGVDNLSWARCTASREASDRIRAEQDEMAVWAVGMAALLRFQGKLAEARRMLEENVLDYDRSVFKGPTKDDYVMPAATYEMGVIAWAECCSPPEGTPGEVAAYRRKKLDECQGQLDKAKAWESFTLDARIGMRVQSGLETLGWFRKKMGWT